jgi:hypothetical protein
MRSSVVLLIGLFVIGLLAFGDARAGDFTAPSVVDQRQDMPAPKPKSVTPGLAAPSATSATDRVPSSNPLWAIPLGQLTATRERPLFAPSRRPPPPVVVAKAAPAPPPKPPEPEKPQLVLVGTVVGGGDEGIGLFLSPAEKAPFRLKTGEDHKGWVLRVVRRREVELGKGQQVAVLALPAHEVSKVGSLPPPAATPAVPPAAPPAAPANGTTEAADQVASVSSPPVKTSKTTGGFVLPKRSGAEQPSPIAAAVIQPPAMVFSAPPVNPFQLP